ncbi:MAG: YceD family protein [Gammaproteobacteria bacterium]|nr:YceD family protein [Gammaproteobacteria bacterium]
MQSRLPEYCDLYQLADKSATMSGYWPVAKMPRLLTMLAADGGEVKAELEFGRDGRIRFIKGIVSVDVEMQCQRCLDSTTVSLNTEFLLALVDNESQIGRLPEQYEALMTEGRHYLPDVIEDELILAVPIIATHDSDCSDYVKEFEAVPAEHQQEEAVKKPNPFAVLKDLL